MTRMLGTKKQRREVLKEDENSKLDLILEYVMDIPKMKETMEKQGQRMEKTETDIAIIKIDLKKIDSKLDQKASRVEFREHERRITALE